MCMPSTCLIFPIDSSVVFTFVPTVSVLHWTPTCGVNTCPAASSSSLGLGLLLHKLKGLSFTLDIFKLSITFSMRLFFGWCYLIFPSVSSLPPYFSLNIFSVLMAYLSLPCAHSLSSIPHHGKWLKSVIFLSFVYGCISRTWHPVDIQEMVTEWMKADGLQLLRKWKLSFGSSTTSEGKG